MNLPIEIVEHGGTGPLGGLDLPRVRVDGHWPGHGLVLSHWPGHDTPPDLRHDLSTGAALRFAALESAERARRTAGAVSIANNHYDTDGVCALWSVRYPDQALPRAARLLETAAAGDFFAVPSEEAYLVDLCVSGLGHATGPLFGALEGLPPRASAQLRTDHWMTQLGPLLDGDREPYRALWEPGLESLAEDNALLRAGLREEDPALDLTLWRALADGVDAAAPGRHALQGGTPRDLALYLGVSGSTAAGTGVVCRLLLSTRAWFDLPSRASQSSRASESPESASHGARPDLRPLATRLNELEGTEDGDLHAWRAQPPENASPELWFGGRELAHFAERNEVLARSSLTPERVLHEVRGALREARQLSQP